ncbi:MAG TPA: hypothetical protein VIB79_10485 [Candidatus Binatia bacterium]
MKRIIVVALAVATLAFGCGKKSDPRAPELAAPEPITNLSAKAAPNGVVLTWSRPTHYVDGSEIKDLASFVVFRKEIPQTCPECVVPYRQITTVYVEDRERFVKQKQYRYIDEEPQSGRTFRYRVSSQLTDGTLSEPSNEVEITRGP